MSKDIYLVYVHEDGDTEIRSATVVPPFNTYVVRHSVGAVVDELVSYGHSEEQAKEAIKQMTENPLEWIKVW